MHDNEYSPIAVIVRANCMHTKQPLVVLKTCMPKINSDKFIQCCLAWLGSLLFGYGCFS